jgi:hypothetical protein
MHIKLPVNLHVLKQPGQAHRCNLFRNRGIDIVAGSIPIVVLRFLLPMLPREGEARWLLIGNCVILAFLVEMFWGHSGELNAERTP